MFKNYLVRFCWTLRSSLRSLLTFDFAWKVTTFLINKSQPHQQNVMVCNFQLNCMYFYWRVLLLLVYNNYYFYLTAETAGILRINFIINFFQPKGRHATTFWAFHNHGNVLKHLLMVDCLIGPYHQNIGNWFGIEVFPTQGCMLPTGS